MAYVQPKSSPLDHVVVDQIALEGLDGITLSALFLRLSKLNDFPIDCNDSQAKEYIWKCIICNKRLLQQKCLQIFQLPQARPELVYYDRNEHLNPNTGFFSEANSCVPVDIYAPFNPVLKDGIIGSCKYFNERVDITYQFIDQNWSLDEVKKKFANKLVIVASQELRNEALGINFVDATLTLSEIVYCYLEKIGRSRNFGVPTVGKESPQIEPRTVFYYRKILAKHNLITTSNFFLHNSSNVTISGRIVYLKRFYTFQPSVQDTMALQVSEYLLTQENNESDWSTVNSLLEGHSKKAISNMLAAFTKNFQLTVKKYKNEGRFTKQSIRLLEPVNLDRIEDELNIPDEDDFSLSGNSSIKLETQDDQYDDQQRSYDPKLILADRHLLSQVLTAIEVSNGLTQIDIVNKFNFSKLDARTICHVLLRRGFIKTIREVHGKTKINKFVPLHQVQHSDAALANASRGLSHDSKDTVAYLNRANIILNMIEEMPDHIILGLNSLVLEIKKIENSTSMVDRKSVYRIIKRLEKEGKLKHYITDHPIKKRTIKLIAICGTSVNPDDEHFRERMLKWKHRISSDSSTPDASTSNDADDGKSVKKSKGKGQKRTKDVASTSRKRLNLDVENICQGAREGGARRNISSGNENEIAIIEVDSSDRTNVDSQVDKAIYILDPVVTSSVQRTFTSVGSTDAKSKGNSSTSLARKRAKLFDESSQHIVLSPQPKTKKVKRPSIKEKPRKAKYDEKDQQALSKLMSMRCRWSNSEDRFLLLCRVASVLLDPTCNTNVCVQARLIRDELHKRVPAASDKTGKACQRRILYLLKSAITRRQVSDLVSEFRQSDLGDIKKPTEPKTKEDVWNRAFLETLHKVLDKFSSPTPTLEEENYEKIDLNDYKIIDLTCESKENLPAFFKPMNQIDISHNIISNILLSSLLINKMEGSDMFKEQLFKIYKKFPDALIRSVINRFKHNGISANIKKCNPKENEQINHCRPMPFKISSQCDSLLQTKLTMSKLIRPIESLNETKTIIRERNRERSDACFTTSLFASGKAKFSLKIPDDHITLQEKCPFFKPPAESSSSPSSSSNASAAVVATSSSSSSLPCPSLEKNPNSQLFVDRHKSSRSFLFALREQLDINGSGNSKQEKLSDFLVVNECPVEVEVTKYSPIDKSFWKKVKEFCEPVIATMEMEKEKGEREEEKNEDPILNFVKEKRELGASERQIISHLGYWPREEVEQLITRKLLFRLGVDTFHLVHVNFIDDWLVETVNDKGESIKFIPKVWTNAAGQCDKRLIYQIMSALLGHIVQKPGIPVSCLLLHYKIIAPAVQLMEILELLESAGCISLTQLESIASPKLFVPVMEIKSINLQKGAIGQGIRNEQLFCEAMPEAFIKLGHLCSLLTSCAC